MLIVLVVFIILVVCLLMYSENFTSEKFKDKEKDKEKFIYFKIDCGGLNNIRMQFEILTCLAFLSKRTLVLPPKTQWYLLGNELLEPSDIYDINSWRKYVKVKTAAESELGQFANHYNNFFEELEKMQDVVEPKWAVVDGFIKPGDIDLYSSNRILYFYCSEDNLHRIMASIECYFSNFNKKELYKIISESLQFKQEYFDIAKEKLKTLGLIIGNYNAIHVRNWEGSVPQQKIAEDNAIIKKINTLNKNLPVLYLSKEVLDNYKTINTQEYKIVYPLQDTNEKTRITSITDMIMAAYANRFIGSKASTYSTGIMLMRGQLHKLYPSINTKIEFIDDFDHTTCNDDVSNFHVIHHDRVETFTEYTEMLWNFNDNIIL